jgi:hypothetical protein
MSGFLAGLFTGVLIGAVITLLVLMIVAGIKSPERTPAGQVSHRKVFLATVVLLAICGICYSFDLEKSALLALLLSVLMIAKLGGSKRGIVAAGIAAAMLAWFLPPNGSLWRFSSSGRSWQASSRKGTSGSNAGLPAPTRIGSKGNEWCRRGESNPRPRDYETLALPLSYAGKLQFFMLRTSL